MQKFIFHVIFYSHYDSAKIGVENKSRFFRSNILPKTARGSICLRKFLVSLNQDTSRKEVVKTVFFSLAIIITDDISDEYEKKRFFRCIQ